jgi:hypothetical protein
MVFERSFDGIDDLKKAPLFKDFLLRDITDSGGDVFPAVRKDEMDFYHKGGLLFSYDTRFETEYHQGIGSFEEDYERIKENCSLRWKGDERQKVSQLYESLSCAKYERSTSVVVLDIEICLKSEGEAGKTEHGRDSQLDRDIIDLLLFDTESGLLRFFEAKHYKNDAIRADNRHEPNIVDQMNRYKEQLNTDRNVHNEMLKSYAAHVNIINQVFELEPSLPPPQIIDPTVRLLIFGFDNEQKIKLESEVDRLENEYGLYVYSKGDIKQVDPSALFSGGRNHWPVTPVS